MSFAFNPDEAWDASGSILQRGDHLCTVLEIDATKDSSGGYPQIEVKVGNEQGDIRDWIVISSPQTFGKFTALVLASGMTSDGYPQPGTDFDESSGRVSQAYAGRLVGRRVGVIVRDEPSLNDSTKMRSRVQGYVPPERLRTTNGSTEMPADTTGLPTVSSAKSASARTGEAIPF